MLQALVCEVYFVETYAFFLFGVYFILLRVAKLNMYTANRTSLGVLLPIRLPQGNIYATLPTGDNWSWGVCNGVISIASLTFTLTERSIVFVAAVGA